MADDRSQRIAGFVADRLAMLPGGVSPALIKLCEELLTDFIIDEQWLWDAPDHADALAALDRLRALVPLERRREAQPLALAIRSTLTEQARRIARLEDKAELMQEHLVMLSEQLKRARAGKPP